MKKIVLLFITILLLAGSCRKNEPVAGVTPAEARDTVYYIMKQWYYWYNFIPAINKDDYADPYTMLEAMRYKTYDKWSFVADYDEFNAEMNGTFVGHGIRIGLDNAHVARIAMIYNNSPLSAQSHVKRGWIVKQVSGVDIAAAILANDATAYNNAFGPSTTGYQNTFLFQRPDGKDTTIISAKSTFTINSVLVYDTLKLKGGGVAGHLVFESFIQPSEAELATAFAWFKTKNVTDLILDLRYNSGGYLYIAEELASYIAGNSRAGSIFAQLSYNDKNTTENSSYPFVTTPSPMSLSRIVVITTRLTASASEAVMNGLAPFITVVSVGDTTNGKPVGMNGWPIGNKYWFWPITFKLVNSAGSGDYFDGIIPNKLASDDIRYDFSNRNESSLKEAIYYLENGSFSAKGADSFFCSRSFGEKPAWMNNVFIER